MGRSPKIGELLQTGFGGRGDPVARADLVATVGDGGAVTFELAQAPDRGRVSVNADGRLLYEADKADYLTSLLVRVRDRQGASQAYEVFAVVGFARGYREGRLPPDDVWTIEFALGAVSGR